MIRRLAHSAAAFLDWLDAHDLTLSNWQQASLGHWLADEQASPRRSRAVHPLVR
jgi:hypothetical protein